MTTQRCSAQGEIDELRVLAKPLRGRSIEMINSTAVGGGVAEILNRLLPLAEELELNMRWDVMTGGDDFYGVTKAFHNALHGAPYHADPKDFEIFLACNERNRARLPLDAEFMIIHDPQPAALIEGRKKNGNHWAWRCHIDLSHPNRAVWDFLEKFVARYDAAMFSSPEFSRSLAIPQYLFYPAIDPLSEKNRELERGFVAQTLARYQIDPLRPILTQISRFDRLKDPVGVIRAYRIVKRYFDCQLVLAGGSASDDPEGAVVLKEVQRRSERRSGHSHHRTTSLGSAGGERAAARFDDCDSEEPARGIRVDGFRGAVEEETGGGFGGWRHSCANHPQAYGASGALGRRHGVSNSLFVVASGDRGEAWREWA